MLRKTKLRLLRRKIKSKMSTAVSKRSPNLNGFQQRRFAPHFMPAMGSWHSALQDFTLAPGLMQQPLNIDNQLREGKDNMVNHAWLLELLSKSVSHLIGCSRHMAKFNTDRIEKFNSALGEAANIGKHTDYSTCLKLLWYNLLWKLLTLQ